MKAKELRVKFHEIKLKDCWHKIAFDMNVMAEIEEEYGTIELGMTAFNKRPIKAIIVFIWAFLKQEEKYLNITIKEAGQLIDMSLLQDYIVEIQKVIVEAMPNAKEEKTEETESPNV